jgi:hypothetical protein
MAHKDDDNFMMVSQIGTVKYRFQIKFSRWIEPCYPFAIKQASLGSAEGMKNRSSLLKCCHDDESTTNQISRTIREISTWDTWKSLPIRVQRIPNATVPIGTDLDLCQACCDDGKGNSEPVPWWCLQETLYLNQYLPDLDKGIFESHLQYLNFLTPIRWCKLGQRLLSHCNSYNKQWNGTKLCSKDDHKNCCIFINISRILMIQC